MGPLPCVFEKSGVAVPCGWPAPARLPVPSAGQLVSCAPPHHIPEPLCGPAFCPSHPGPLPCSGGGRLEAPARSQCHVVPRLSSRRPEGHFSFDLGPSEPLAPPTTPRVREALTDAPGPWGTEGVPSAGSALDRDVPSQCHRHSAWNRVPGTFSAVWVTASRQEGHIWKCVGPWGQHSPILLVGALNL